MPILVKSDEIRSGRKVKVCHGWLRRHRSQWVKICCHNVASITTKICLPLWGYLVSLISRCCQRVLLFHTLHFTIAGFYNTQNIFDSHKLKRFLKTICFKVHLTPKYFFRSNKSFHLFEMHCTFLPCFNPKLDFLQAVKVMKSGHYLLHDRASKGYGSFPGLTSQTDLHCIKSL